MHCHQYSHKKRWWQIVFVCSTTLPHCIETLQVLWYKQKQFMRASGHSGAFWQLCCAESWLIFLAPNAPNFAAQESTLTQRQVMSCSQTSSSHQDVNTKKAGYRLWDKNFGELNVFEFEKQFLHMFHESIYFSAYLSIYVLTRMLTYTWSCKNSCKS